ncbi:MAG TPA: GNAT family N-acetyltransferase [Polyangiaceae bacterium]|nr:GNAT family N-acetyltransferase [Polyangiaceae bacterium]
MSAPPRNKVSADQLKVRSLGAADSAVLASFSCGEPDLDDFLRSDALRLQGHRVVHTYLAFFDTTLVGYMSMLADAVVLETKERKRLSLSSHDHPGVPALKIARLGVAESFRATHSGAGAALVQIALALALDTAQRVGCRLLTVDAYPQSVAFYERLGFVSNRAKVYQGRQHPSMRLDIFPSVPHAWVT